MPTQPRVATCSYCGTRTAFVLRGTQRHALTCVSCGASLHELKKLKTPPSEPVAQYAKRNPRLPVKRKTYKKKKSMIQRVLEELIDEIEDIFD